jgi:aminopyrrolnitrin oxygenase
MSEETSNARPRRLISSERAHSPTMRLAASWYVVAPSDSLKTRPVPITMFGRALVAWRDGEGRAVLMDRHCAHLGASLADGDVVDGELRCPFHAWRYDASGQCVYVPADRANLRCPDGIPVAARQRTYPTIEHYGYVWTWYGSAEPLHPLPPFAPAGQQSSDFMCLRFTFPTSTSVLRVVENFYDAQHANPVHTLPIKTFSLRLLEGEPPTQELLPLYRAGAWFGAAIGFEVDRYFGPLGMAARTLGLHMKQMNLHFDGFPAGCVMTVSLDGDLKYKLLQAVTPVRDGETVMHMLIAIRKRAGLPRRLADLILYGLQTRVAASYDVAIWNGMQPDGGGAYSRYDRLVLRYRGFYRRWVDRVEDGPRLLPRDDHAPESSETASSPPR